MTIVLLRGDARHLPFVDSSIDLIVTSPPYWKQRSYTDKGNVYPNQIGTERTFSEYIDNLIYCTSEWIRVLKPTGSLWVNLGDKYTNRSLAGLPWRYALRCTDELKLILRAEIIWNKSNGLPESVTDRVSRKHEQWFHLVKLSHYYADINSIRERTNIGARPVETWTERKNKGNKTHAPENGHATGVGMAPHTEGKCPSSVWTIGSQPLIVPEELEIDHYAAFPMEFPRRIIKAWSPDSGVVLDPFGGTGTTALVAAVLGRTGISVELSSDYCRVAAWRTTDKKQIEQAQKNLDLPMSKFIVYAPEYGFYDDPATEADHDQSCYVTYETYENNLRIFANVVQYS